MTPWEELAERLTDPALGAYAGNVYPAPVESITPPAIVLRPGSPWILEAGEDRPSWCAIRHAYVAVAIVVASTPSDGQAELMAALLAIRAAAGDAGWTFRDAGAPVVDETTGIPLLAAAANLTYDQSEG